MWRALLWLLCFTGCATHYTTDVYRSLTLKWQEQTRRVTVATLAEARPNEGAVCLYGREETDRLFYLDKAIPMRTVYTTPYQIIAGPIPYGGCHRGANTLLGVAHSHPDSYDYCRLSVLDVASAIVHQWRLVIVFCPHRKAQVYVVDPSLYDFKWDILEEGR